MKQRFSYRRILSMVSTFLLTMHTVNASAKFDFANPSAKLVIGNNGTGRFKSQKPSDIIGWERENIITSTGNIPATSWSSSYSLGAVDRASGTLSETVGTPADLKYIGIHGPISVSSENYDLINSLVLSSTSALTFNSSSVFDGGGNTITFATNQSTQLFLAAGTTVELKNVVLENFSDDVVSFGTDSQLIFGDGCYLHFVNRQHLANGRTWIFKDNVHIIGNAQVLDLTTGGTLRIKSGSTVYCSNVKIDGLGKGSAETRNIYCDDNTGRLRFNNVHLGLSNDYTFTQGGIYVEGDSVAVTKHHLLTFDQHATLTVDGSSFTYETLGAPDNNNIRVTTPSSSNIVYLNNGTAAINASSYIVPYDVSLSTTKPFMFNASCTVQGNGHTITFAANQPNQMVLADEVTVEFKDVVLLNYADSAINFGTNAKIIFGNNCYLRLNGDQTILPTNEWVFKDNAYLNAGASVLDLTHGGTLHVSSGARLYLSDIKVKGIGSGGAENIIFDDNASGFTLNAVELELANTYTFRKGGILVEGTSSVITKDNLLVFDAYATLTVNGTSLTYETLAYPDSNNIRAETSYAGGIVYRRGGSSFIVRTIPQTTIFDQDTIMGLHIVASPGKNIRVVNSDQSVHKTITIDGNLHFIYFGFVTSSPILTIDPNCTVLFKNITLWNVSPESIHLGNGSSVIFGDNVIMRFEDNQELKTTWTFQGIAKISGGGHYLDLAHTGSIYLRGQGSSLLFDDITLKGISGTNIRMQDNTSTFSFKDVRWQQDASYTFTTGRFEIIGDTILTGDSTFDYKTDQKSTIASEAMLTVDRDMIFSYAPASANRDLLAMTDETSTFFLNGCTLKSTTTGIRFTKGTILIDNQVKCYNDNATSLSQAIEFGNGSAHDNVKVFVMPGASINLETGLLNYNNVE